MIDNRTWRRTRLLGAPIAVVALLGLAACGTSTGTSTSTAAEASAEAPADTAQGGTGDTDMAAYQSCLEENGVSMPERPAGAGQGGAAPQGDAGPQGGTPPSGAPAAGGPGGPGGSPDQVPPGVDDDTWAAAQEACSDLAPAQPGGAASTASPVS